MASRDNWISWWRRADDGDKTAVVGGAAVIVMGLTLAAEVVLKMVQSWPWS